MIISLKLEVRDNHLKQTPLPQYLSANVPSPRTQPPSPPQTTSRHAQRAVRRETDRGPPAPSKKQQYCVTASSPESHFHPSPRAIASTIHSLPYSDLTARNTRFSRPIGTQARLPAAAITSQSRIRGPRRSPTDVARTAPGTASTDWDREGTQRNVSRAPSLHECRWTV